MVKEPARVNVCVTVAPDAVKPSPKDQVGTRSAAADNVTGIPTAACVLRIAIEPGADRLGGPYSLTSSYDITRGRSSAAWSAGLDLGAPPVSHAIAACVS